MIGEVVVSESKVNKKPLLMLISIVGVALGTILYQSPNIPWLCIVFNNCSTEQQFEEIYQQASRKAHKAAQQATVSSEISALRKSYIALRASIEELKNIPTESTVYSKAQDSIKNYEKELTEINKNIAQEKSKKEEVVQVKSTQKPIW